MDLKAKLGLHLKKKEKVNNEETSEVRETIYEPIHEEYRLSHFLPGKIVETELGEYLLVEYRYPLQHFHGRFSLGYLEESDFKALPGVLKDQNLTMPNGLTDLVFLDTETTGLAGGAGTFAFLVGVGFFEHDEFVLRQYMMEDYHQELAMISELHRELGEFTHLVTFNGKSYDWPLLNTRFTYHRIREERTLSHVDLLHPARRYYKRRLQDCSLGSIERNVLGFPRMNDISGSQVPELFFRFLQEQDGRILLPVFQHNHWDILSLVTLLGHLLQAYLEPEATIETIEDLYSIGRVYEQNGEVETAMYCYRCCLKKDPAPMLSKEIQEQLSFLHKKLGQYEEACQIWRQLIETDPNVPLYPFVELAKHYEHKCQDYHMALEMTRRAIELLLKRRRFFNSLKFKEKMAALQHRESRLLRKMGRENLA